MAGKGVLEGKHYVVAGLLRKQRRRRRKDNQKVRRISRTEGFRSAPSGAVMKIRTPALAGGIYGLKRSLLRSPNSCYFMADRLSP